MKNISQSTGQAADLAGTCEDAHRLIVDPKMPHLRTLWSRKRMKALFNRTVMPALSPGQEVSRVRRAYTAYKPGKECVCLFQLWCGNGAKDSQRIAVVTFAKETRLRKAHNRICEAQRNGAGAASPGTTLYLPDYPCLVEFFPTDWKLPTLARATDPAEVAELLGSSGLTDPSRVLRCQVVRYRPRKRCVLRYVLQSADGSEQREVMGKVYPEWPKAAEVSRKMQALRSQGSATGLVIPAALDVADKGTLVLMERVPGTNMKDVLDATTTENEAKTTISVAAETLARFHRMRFENQDVRTIDGELRELRERVARLHVVAPLLARRVDALLDQIEPLAQRFPAGPLCLIHGDFKPSQLLLDGDRVAVVDLDRACLGDPAIDVGNFMAVLRKEALVRRNAHVDRLCGYFLDEYEARSQGTRLADRARFYQCIALVRGASRRFERSPRSYRRDGERWRPLLLLDEAAAALERLHDG